MWDLRATALLLGACVLSAEATAAPMSTGSRHLWRFVAQDNASLDFIDVASETGPLTARTFWQLSVPKSPEPPKPGAPHQVFRVRVNCPARTIMGLEGFAYDAAGARDMSVDGHPVSPAPETVGETVLDFVCTGAWKYRGARDQPDSASAAAFAYALAAPEPTAPGLSSNDLQGLAQQFHSLYGTGGMIGVVEYLHTCYASAGSNRTRLERCSVLDIVAKRMDDGFRGEMEKHTGAQLPPTPYLTDAAFQARIREYVPRAYPRGDDSTITALGGEAVDVEGRLVKLMAPPAG